MHHVIHLFQTCSTPLNSTQSTVTSPSQYAQVRLINPKIISTYVCFYFEKGRKITNHKLIFTTKGIGNNSESVYIRRVVYNAQLHGYRVRMSYHSPPAYLHRTTGPHSKHKTTPPLHDGAHTTLGPHILTYLYDGPHTPHIFNISCLFL